MLSAGGWKEIKYYTHYILYSAQLSSPIHPSIHPPTTTFLSPLSVCPLHVTSPNTTWIYTYILIYLYIYIFIFIYGYTYLYTYLLIIHSSINTHHTHHIYIYTHTHTLTHSHLPLYKPTPLSIYSYISLSYITHLTS